MPQFELEFVHELPIVPGAVYYLDIDGTLLKISDDTTPRLPPGPLNLRHPADAAHVRHLAMVATVVYVTSRDATTRDRTLSALGSAGFPTTCPMYMSDVHHTNSFNKGHIVMRDLLKRPENAPVFFVDDVHYNVEDVLAAVPHATAFLIRPATAAADSACETTPH
jgi:hypothetical protein